MIDPVDYISFGSNEWNVIKVYLQQIREKKVSLLIGDRSHDESNKIRGALSVIDGLLRLETAVPGPHKED